MGMSCTWESERGFGERSWRYSCVINDMKVEKMFVEVRNDRARATDGKRMLLPLCFSCFLST
jgi:peroxiredoxin